MKKLLIAFILALFSYQANSQVLISLLLGDKLNSDGLEFGLEGGFNWSSMSGLETNSALSQFNLGFYFDIRVKNQWFLNTGVLVKSAMGVNKLTDNDLTVLDARTYADEGTYSQVVRYFAVPILAKYKFDNRFFLAAGPQINLRNRAWIEFNSDNDGIEAKIRQDNRDAWSRFDVGVTGNLGYQLQKGLGMSFGIKYYQGFVDIYKVDANFKNRSFFVYLMVPIGKGKAELD
ncbi:porin family protein [Algoriphagus sediminis]|uniref:Porin family protein n=1 Tax=Algoriphagus sediminis TaxID=3057113 RepID=A0ABT7Y8B7_9BACT|nr:porin family protein [Algoriphagus sediminis]MDN3202760.1 porin family protein [Algoriphagus sediminis]